MAGPEVTTYGVKVIFEAQRAASELAPRPLMTGCGLAYEYRGVARDLEKS